MKTMIALFLMILSAAGSAQAATLLTAQRNPGFEPKPQSFTFVLETNGRMTLTIRSYRENTTKTEELGRLSKVALDKISARIQAIPGDARLVDSREGEPLCTDAPSTEVKVVRDGQEREIYRWASCHEWNIASYEAQELRDLSKGFLNL